MSTVVELSADRTIIADFEFVISTSNLEELRLRPPVGNDKYSPDVMSKKAGRPPVGVQGMILDAMDDERITRAEASMLLTKVNARLHGCRAGMGKVLADGSVVPMEAIADGR